MTDLLGIGASGLSTYRTALSVVGDNVANAETKGYVRREVNFASSGAIGSSGPLYNDITGGSGVRASAITRAADVFRDADSRLTQSDSSRADTRARWLSLAEGQLPDDDTGIGAKLTAVYTAAQGLAADPNGTVAREQMGNAISIAAARLRQSGEGLARLSEGIVGEAGSVAGSLNANLSELVTVNNSIARLAPGTAGLAAAFDQRDRLLDAISGQVAIDASFDSRGRATVTLAQTGGVALLDANGAGVLHVAATSDGRVALAVEQGGTTTSVSPVGGSLAGLVDSAATLAGRRRQLDGIADDFAAQLNAWNAAGTTPAGVAGGALLNGGNGAAGLTVATTDPGAFAAANASSANGNALALASLRRTGGIEARAASMVTALAQSVAGAKAEATTAAATAAHAALARDEVAGVDLDREAAELIRFQQAYNGSAKIVQVARETLQSVLELF